MEGPLSDDSKQNTRHDCICSKPSSANVDEMGSRIDELERSIKELKAEMGPEDSPSLVPSSNSKPDEVKPEETTE